MNQIDLRNAAIVHACIPTEYRHRAESPLVALIPDGIRPSDDVIALAEAITGKRFDADAGPANARIVLPPRLRAFLNRWAIQQPGVMGERDDVRAREMWKAVTA